MVKEWQAWVQKKGSLKKQGERIVVKVWQAWVLKKGSLVKLGELKKRSMVMEWQLLVKEKALKID